MVVMIPVHTSGGAWSFPPQNFADWFTLGYLAVLVVGLVCCIILLIRTLLN